MSPVVLLNLMFWMFFFWQIVGGAFGILTRKEWLSIQIVIDVIIMVTNLLTFFIQFSAWSVVNLFFFFLFCWFLKRDYKRWKNADDDDDFRKRRRTWLKNKLPKPITKEIPQPI